MAQQLKNNLILLRQDLPASQQRVRAILADWGVSKDSIGRLLGDQRIEAAPLHRPADERTNTSAKRNH